MSTPVHGDPNVDKDVIQMLRDLLHEITFIDKANGKKQNHYLLNCSYESLTTLSVIITQLGHQVEIYKERLIRKGKKI